MSCKYHLHLMGEGSEKSLLIEDFGDAIVCRGRVFLRDTVEHCINTSPGQCWGEYIETPAGSFVDGEQLSRSTQLCIDDVGQSFVITEIVSTDPICIRTSRHLGVPSYSTEEENIGCLRGVAKLGTRRNYDKLIVCSFNEDASALLIPAEIDGLPVRGVELLNRNLENIETLIISEGIEELSIDFYGAHKLSRLVIPEGITLPRALDNIGDTLWFRSQPPQPIYISDCYCGTPGGGSNGVRSLNIPEGISYVSAGADFHSYWHSIKTPSSLCRIGAMAFATNHCLEELNLSEGLRRIDAAAFYGVNRLKSLYLPDSLITLGDGCFKDSWSLQEVSVGKEKFANGFKVHSLTIRSPEGDSHLSLSPPIVVPLTDRISAYPKGSAFCLAEKSYNSLEELTAYSVRENPGLFLDIHGRKIWSIGVYDRCRPTDDGGYECIQRWFYKDGGCVTQIEQVKADGTILVREGVGILDVPYVLRDFVGEIFEFE